MIVILYIAYDLYIYHDKISHAHIVALYKTSQNKYYFNK